MPHPASAPTDRLGGGRGLRVLAALVAGGMLALVASPALAAEGSIDHVESHDGTVQVLYSTPDGAEPALDTLQVQLDGKPLEASATLASDATDAVRRTAVLAIDVSNSMKSDGKFVEAKRAAQIFLASVPTDLYVGIVTFAGKVQVVQRPTLDRAASRRLVGGLRLSNGTLLYDGLRQAVALGGRQGQRSVIVLSDGRDTSRTRLSAVTDQIKRADTKVDVVALAQSAREKALLSPLSTAGHGAVISANDSVVPAASLVYEEVTQPSMCAGGGGISAASMTCVPSGSTNAGSSVRRPTRCLRSSRTMSLRTSERLPTKSPLPGFTIQPIPRSSGVCVPSVSCPTMT